MKIKSLAGLGMLLMVLSLFGCAAASEPGDDKKNIAYREEMAELICKIKDYARDNGRENFYVIANGGAGLMEANEYLSREEHERLMKHLDGVMAESVNYGWDMEMDNPMPPEEQREYHRLLFRAKRAGIVPLVIDYCEEPANVQKSYRENATHRYLGWASARRDLDRLPEGLPHNDNDWDVTSLSEAQNFITLLNPESFRTKENFVQSLAASNYDVLIIDAFFGDDMLDAADLARLQKKPMGGKRLVFAYMSVGEAEDYRYYWQSSWENAPPDWMSVVNDDWVGNYRVKYWTQTWQNYLMGSPDSYLDRIMAAGFDGAFLDVVDAYETFENQ